MTCFWYFFFPSLAAKLIGPRTGCQFFKKGEDVSLTPLLWAVNVSTVDTKGPPDGRYSVCTVAAILDNCFTELVFCGLACSPLG